MKNKINSFASYTFFGSVHWGHTWERQHEIVTRFAKLLPSHDIYVCAPLGAVNYNPFTSKFIQKVISYHHSQKKESYVASNPITQNMRMISPPHIPYHNRFLAPINFSLISKKMGFTDNNFFWSSYINQEIYEFFRKSSFRIYDIAARRSKSKDVPQSIKDLERRVVEEADLVVVDNKATIDDYKGLNDRIIYIPQGVNKDSFFPISNSKREYIGYIGNLHYAIDYEYLYKLININKSEKFLIIGAVLEEKAQRILTLPNVTHIDQIPKNELNKYLGKMKLGLIPYLINDVTAGVYPTKLFEYLAANVPVLSTPLPEVMQYENPYYLKICETPLSLSNISFAMKGVEELINNNTWDARWKAYLSAIEMTL